MRVIPVLGLWKRGLYKTVRFKNPRYIGDPLNAVKVFNEKGVDELLICGFRQTIEKQEPDWDVLEQLCSEAFIPMAYIGGVNTMSHVERLVRMGFEKIGISTAAFQSPGLLKEMVASIGSSSVFVSLDYRKGANQENGIHICSGSKFTGLNLKESILRIQDAGVGELILQNIDKDGTYSGVDIETMNQVKSIIHIPCILLGGASGYDDVEKAKGAGADALAASSMFVFYGRHRAVLINYPVDLGEMF